MDRAAALLSRAFAARRLLPAREATAVAVENAFFLARCRGEHALAARLLDAEARERGPDPRFDRALAAVHLAAGRPEEALDACERALAQLDRAGWRRRPAAPTEREQVVQMRDEARRSVSLPRLDGLSGGRRTAV
jgi:hypothetical protein